MLTLRVIRPARINFFDQLQLRYIEKVAGQATRNNKYFDPQKLNITTNDN